jgi:hypothetical protein
MLGAGPSPARTHGHRSRRPACAATSASTRHPHTSPQTDPEPSRSPPRGCQHTKPTAPNGEQQPSAPLHRPAVQPRPELDLIITGEQVAILSVTGLNRMFADIEVAKLLVPDHVEAITSALARASRMKPRRRPSKRCGKSTASTNSCDASRTPAAWRKWPPRDPARAQRARNAEGPAGEAHHAARGRRSRRGAVRPARGPLPRGRLTGEGRKAARFSVGKRAD